MLVYCPVCGWELDYGVNRPDGATIRCEKCKQLIVLRIEDGDFTPAPHCGSSFVYRCRKRQRRHLQRQSIAARRTMEYNNVGGNQYERSAGTIPVAGEYFKFEETREIVPRTTL